MATRQTHPTYCTSCEAYLGEIVPGYVKSVQCFCGEVTVVSSDLPKIQDDEAELHAVAS